MQIAVSADPDGRAFGSNQSTQSSGSNKAYSFNSLESLVDMSVCAVHCGRLERPKLLPCGHVFCLACLDKWAERQGGPQFECPMCRRRVQRPETGAAGLPNALAHQAILDYILKQKAHALRHRSKRPQRQQSDGEQQQHLMQPPHRPMERKQSVEMRQDLLSQLSDDLLRRADTAAPDAFDRAELATVRDNLSRVLQRLDDAPTPRGAAGEELEVDAQSESGSEESAAVATAADEGEAAAAADAYSATQREMQRLSRYRVRQLSVPWDDSLTETEAIAGAGLLRRPADGRARRPAPAAVLLSSESRRLLTCGGGSGGGGGGGGSSLRGHRLTPLPVELPGGGGGRELRVSCLHTAKGAVYLTGWNGRHSVLAIVSPEDGAILRCQTREEATEADAESGFAGFHVELECGSCVVAEPGRQRVEFFDQSLRPTGHWLVFDRLRPRHVAWAKQAETLWVSCPEERLVLAVNDRTGVFRKLSTGDIFQSPPEYIVASQAADDRGGCRVVLADSEQGRLFWIRKRRKFIFLQRLQLPCDLPSITSLSAMEDGRLLVTSRDRIFRLKRTRTEAQRQKLRCQVL